MKVLVLGATGMLGHVVHSYLSKKTVRVYGSSRKPQDKLPVYCDLLKADTIESAVELGCWDVVINCAGIVTRLVPSVSTFDLLAVNGVAPHLINEACIRSGARLIHISTDCVFSGKKGMYEESDIPDAEDLYGKSKSYGEVRSPGLTIRTSIIGPEVSEEKKGLFEWFRKQTSCFGFTNHIWSGVTTLQLARTIYSLMLRPEMPRGILHVHSKPISKFDLLVAINEEFNLGIEVVPISLPNGHDKSLISHRGDLGVPDIRKQLRDLNEWMKG